MAELLRGVKMELNHTSMQFLNACVVGFCLSSDGGTLTEFTVRTAHIQYSSYSSHIVRTGQDAFYGIVGVALCGQKHFPTWFVLRFFCFGHRVKS